MFVPSDALLLILVSPPRRRLASKLVSSSIEIRPEQLNYEEDLVKTLYFDNLLLYISLLLSPLFKLHHLRNLGSIYLLNKNEKEGILSKSFSLD